MKKNITLSALAALLFTTQVHSFSLATPIDQPLAYGLLLTGAAITAYNNWSNLPQKNPELETAIMKSMQVMVNGKMQSEDGSFKELYSGSHYNVAVLTKNSTLSLNESWITNSSKSATCIIEQAKSRYRVKALWEVPYFSIKEKKPDQSFETDAKATAFVMQEIDHSAPLIVRAGNIIGYSMLTLGIGGIIYASLHAGTKLVGTATY